MRANNIKYSYTCLTKDDIDDIIRMRTEGYTLKYIADYIGCTQSAVKYQCDKRGIPNMNSLKWSYDEEETLIKLHSLKTPLQSISNTLHRSIGAIIMRIRKLRENNRII